MFISWNNNKNRTNNYISSNIQNIPKNSTQFLISQQTKRTSSLLLTNSLNNEETNSSSQIFQNENIPLNTSFLSECETDFDFLTENSTQHKNPFKSIEAFIPYYDSLSNKTETIHSIIQDKSLCLSLLQSQSGIDIIIYIIQHHQSISLCNIIIYYISCLNKNQKRNILKLLTYLYNYGNVFVKNQITSLICNI